MTDGRPDPDAILGRIKDAEARAARGKLKIFFGASAGVGKTFAMLSAARQKAAQGVDLLIGVVETHGRKETEALVEGLPRLPPRMIDHRGKAMPEFDIDGALAKHPALILIDELAHSNVAGSRHPKRWQDIEELLVAGIDVYSTVNVQHLETLNDVVGGITGIRVRETVPDHVFDAADEVVLVDLPPDELLQRLKEGKVYLPHQAERAIRNFFRTGNLIALRELALRRTADRVDAQMQRYRHDQSVSSIWQTRDSLLACIGPGRGADRILRSAARIAARLDVPWHAIYVETTELQGIGETRRQAVLKSLRLAQELGADTASLSGGDAAEVAVNYAREHNLSKLVVGRDHLRPWRPWYHSFADRVGQRAPDLDVILVSRDQSPVAKPKDAGTDTTWAERLQAPWQSFVMAVAIGAGITAIATPLHHYFDLANIAMVFLLGVVWVSVRYGLGPSVMATFVNVAAFDFFFVPPQMSFAVSDAQYLLTFAVMLGVGLLTATLTTGLTFQARVAGLREHRMRALYEMSRELSGALMAEQIVEICARFAAAEFEAKAALLLAEDDDRIGAPLLPPDGAFAIDNAIAQWSYDNGREAGCGTGTLPGSSVLYVPLKAPMRLRGIMALQPSDPRRLNSPEQQRLLDTFARLIAISLERIHYVNVASRTTLQMESERLRNSLLSTISHDLRTPLAALVGLADALTLGGPPMPEEQADIARAMRDEALRMSSLVGNLLDMARLQAGKVTLNRQWQPLEEVVGSALAAIKRNTGERHRFVVTLPDDLPLLDFDAVLIERVLTNLLENAVKYTPDGTRIEVGAAVTDEGSVDIRVADEGPGVPAGKEDDIFNMFERGHKESNTPGVGLGLAICRAIVDAHGGRIRAFNRPTGGAEFVFSLPLGKPPVVDGDEVQLARVGATT